MTIDFYCCYFVKNAVLYMVLVTRKPNNDN